MAEDCFFHRKANGNIKENYIQKYLISNSCKNYIPIFKMSQKKHFRTYRLINKLIYWLSSGSYSLMCLYAHILVSSFRTLAIKIKHILNCFWFFSSENIFLMHWLINHGTWYCGKVLALWTGYVCLNPHTLSYLLLGSRFELCKSNGVFAALVVKSMPI